MSERDDALVRELADLRKSSERYKEENQKVLGDLLGLAEVAAQAAIRAGEAANKSLSAAKHALNLALSELSPEAVRAAALATTTAAALAAKEAAAAAALSSSATFIAESSRNDVSTCFEFAGAAAASGKRASEAAEQAVLLAQKAKLLVLGKWDSTQESGSI